jgi:formate hydrogenlyase subunit 3/multisubunit Na+/H+ antiporter MnhD subunit
MLSAGFLGWLRFLPTDHGPLFFWGELLIGIGLFGVIYGVSIGLMQVKPKLVLGYSSISKMGLVTTGFGIALAHPTSAPLLLNALVLFVLHHQLVKSALFVGVDLVERSQARGWAIGGVILLGLALIGAPFTGGALAKSMMTFALPEQSAWFANWLMLAAVTTTLLMGRLVFLLFDRPRKHPSAGNPAWAAWSLLLGMILLLPLVIGEPHQLFTGGISLVLGATIVWMVWFYRPEPLARLVGSVPPADILQPVRRLMRVERRRSAAYVRKLANIAAPATHLELMYRLQDTRLATLFRASRHRQDWNWVGSLWSGLVVLICLVILTWK